MRHVEAVAVFGFQKGGPRTSRSPCPRLELPVLNAGIVRIEAIRDDCAESRNPIGLPSHQQAVLRGKGEQPG
jgi:hypothetical protein